MPTLNIGGQKVTVGDDFLKLSPEQQNSTVDEIASSLPKSTTAPLSKGVIEQAIEPITSYPRTMGDMSAAGLNRMYEGGGQLLSGAKSAVTPTPEGMSPADQAGAGPVSVAKGLGNIALGAGETVFSPITAAYRTFLGQPVENITGIPKEYTEFGAMLATPGIGLTRLPKVLGAIKPAAPLNAGEEVAAAGQRLGVDLPRAVTTDVPGVQQLAKGATSIPGVGTPIRQASEEAIAGLGEAAQDVRAGYGSGNPAAAGTAAQQGITEALRTGPIKQRVTELYDRVDGLVNPTITGELPNTRNLVNTIDARRVNAALPESSATRELGEALSRKGMNYEGIKDLRTYFGEMHDGNLPIPQGMTSGEVKQIYGALSNDMRLIIAKAGGQDGLKAFEQANRAAARWAGIREDLGNLLKVKNEEAIFDKIAAMAGSTARADINLLGRVRGAIGPQNWDEVASAVIGKMGWPPGGTGFSPDQFLTAYKKMSDEGRRLLFRSTNNASHADAIDDIAKVSERFKELNKYANPSGTAQHGATFGLGALAVTAGKAALAGAVMEPLTTVGTIVGGRILSHILARPAPARAMAKWAEATERAMASATPARMNEVEKSARIFAAAVGKDFGRPDLVPDFLKRLQGAVPASAEPDRRSSLDNGQIISDEMPDPIRPGAQYAMEQKRDPYQQIIGGRVRGGEGGAGGGKPLSGEVLSPKSVSTQSTPSLQNQLKELENQQRSLMQLRPMVPTLVRLGVTPEQMTKMTPPEAFQFIKARSPQGMGTVDRGAERMVGDAIDKIREQRSAIQDAINRQLGFK